MNAGVILAAGDSTRMGFPKQLAEVKDKPLLELVIEKVRKGGLIIADNVLWTGKVVEPEKDDDELTQYLIDFNKMINEDDRVENIILPLRDGLNVILKN